MIHQAQLSLKSPQFMGPWEAIKRYRLQQNQTVQRAAVTTYSKVASKADRCDSSLSIMAEIYVETPPGDKKTEKGINYRAYHQTLSEINK